MLRQKDHLERKIFILMSFPAYTVPQTVREEEPQRGTLPPPRLTA
jgi:hypothetical protein